ncbi:unnamed protein product [Anisakis simplex]|uniref:G protein gamma domain-containing protein n=1 Tax=Anisakis simplex TaxID=6269 RepID=A0A0M3JK52_ANISI|nr:unnamed protein product [Anisakis simplex]
MDTNAVTSTQTASVERRELSDCEMELKQKEDELRTLKVDVLRLEETVKEQADMIEVNSQCLHILHSTPQALCSFPELGLRDNSDYVYKIVKF